MASNGMPPEMATEPQMPVLPNGVALVDMLEVTNALLTAAKVAAENSAASQVSQEASDYGTAALKFAQAVTTLDPSRLQGGDTPQARKAAAPDPTPNLPPTKDGDADGKIGS